MPQARSSRPRRPQARGERFDPHVAGVEYGALDELVGYAIRRAQILIYEDFLAALEPWDITPQRFSALTLIAANADLKLTDLARILGIARSGAVQLANQLQDLGHGGPPRGGGRQAGLRAGPDAGGPARPCGDHRGRAGARPAHQRRPERGRAPPVDGFAGAARLAGGRCRSGLDALDLAHQQDVRQRA